MWPLLPAAALCHFLAATPAPQHQQQTEAGRPDQHALSRGPFGIFEEPGRDQKLQINRVMDILGIKRNIPSVADIGAGSGWFTVRAARRVGPGWTHLRRGHQSQRRRAPSRDRAKKEKLDNIRVILGTPDDPKLPQGATSAVLLMKVYHEIATPGAVHAQRCADDAAHPEARVGIIDRNGNGSDHGLNRDVVEREMDEAGFKRGRPLRLHQGRRAGLFSGVPAQEIRSAVSSLLLVLSERRVALRTEH